MTLEERREGNGRMHISSFLHAFIVATGKVNGAKKALTYVENDRDERCLSGRLSCLPFVVLIVTNQAS